ncbi:unnamed protein product [Rotaria sp. Silwood1]|nr:unnamed protein product [Rotaria sp. Silwood1]CAF1640062.1 unnamed protein product [Rotaria sp. Silwood1]CAF3764824.1 unnamed protein product [Rotaria sp. Silwood1]CAF3783614.1 unnamed protein product [Rotaria sp. Silwood1]CAF3820854.1 unnamed protein product [Rotaria sp. Silwood1]
MIYTRPGDRAAQSFGYLLTEIQSLKKLELECSHGIDVITYMPSNIVNDTIINLTIWLFDIKRLIPLLYRFQKLSMLTIYMPEDLIRPMKRAAPPQDVEYYRSRIGEKTSMAYPVRLHHIKVYHYPLVLLEKFEKLIQITTSKTLLTLSLFTCARLPVKTPIPRRQPPFLDSTQWHDILRKYLPSTMKRFYIEYEDVDDTMSRTNSTRVKKEFKQHGGSNLSWEISFTYNENTKYMSFDLAIS